MRASTIVFETRPRVAYITPLIDNRRISITITGKDADSELTGIIPIKELIHLLNKNLVTKTVDKEEEN